MQPTPPDASNSNGAPSSPDDLIQKRNRRRLVTALVAAVVLAIAAIGYQSLTAKPVAPDVTFTSLTGERIDLKSLRGKVVMVNFWATSCSTCVHEMPQMVDTYSRFKDRGLNFVAVAMSYDPPNYVLNFAQTRKLPFTVSLDPQDKLAQSFGDVKLTPTTFLIDQQGKIIKRYVGEPDFAALHRLLDKTLSAS
jgi:peroxiredoxin